MPVCTSCKYGRAVERWRGDVKRLKAEHARLSDICAKCRGSSGDFGGDVHIDAAADPMLVLREADENALAISRMPRLSRVKIDDPEVLQIVLHVVAEFGNVTDIQPEIRRPVTMRAVL